MSLSLLYMRAEIAKLLPIEELKMNTVATL